MKNKLTDFQADWAAMPQVEKEQILKLKNKTIVVSGHSLARCLCYALIYQNETRNISCKVVLCAQDKSLIDDLYPELILREDFDFVDFNSVSEINKRMPLGHPFVAFMLPPVPAGPYFPGWAAGPHRCR